MGLARQRVVFRCVAIATAFLAVGNLLNFHLSWSSQPSSLVFPHHTEQTSSGCLSWGEWSPCSATCGTGDRIRRRPERPACDLTVETQPCTFAPCPCGADEWNAWSKCIGSCGNTGSRRRTRSVLSEDVCASSESQECQVPACQAGSDEEDGDVSNRADDADDQVDGGSDRDREKRTPKLDCAHANQINYVDGDFFAKGYAKTAWRAEFDGHAMVIKRPIDQRHLARFQKGVQWELDWLQKLPAHKHLMRFYGHCSDDKAPFTAVEGELVKFSFVADTPSVSWCHRLQLARQAMDLLALLEHHGLTHCDYKYDQTAIDLDGTLKLVDLKSLRRYPEGLPYKGDKACTKDSKCKICLKGMKFSFEHTCDKARGMCHGYSTSSMVAATAESLFKRLFEHEDARFEYPDSTTKERVSAMIQSAAHQDPEERISRQQVEFALDDLLSSSAAKTCLVETAGAFKQGLRDALATMVDEHSERCKNRYC
eukprot:m.179185 g.179185  ORF g.179185 m.179185 type:complete len:482 (+) comp17989_c0_seq8:238-1683(+)